jgi:hypothetical protein
VVVGPIVGVACAPAKNADVDPNRCVPSIATFLPTGADEGAVAVMDG